MQKGERLLMKKHRIIGIFGIILIVTSVMKLAGISLHPLVDAYEGMVTAVFNWYAPQLISSIDGVTKHLLLWIPLVLFAILALGIVQIIVRRNQLKKRENQCKKSGLHF